MVEIVTGDLLELALAGRFDVVLHGVNCRGIMGAGIGGGHWPVIREIINHRLSGHDHTLVVLG